MFLFSIEQTGPGVQAFIAHYTDGHLNTLQAFNFRCAYCQVSGFEVMEHIIPIAHRGGTTKENCTPACVSCNEHKHAKHFN